MKGKILVTLSLALVLASGLAMAKNSQNEVGAFLVYPAIVALEGGAPDTYESYVTVTNTSNAPVMVHFSYINGEQGDPANTYCDECDFTLPLTGNDTELLVIRWDPNGAGVVVETEPDGPGGGNAAQTSCDWEYGFLVAALEDTSGNPITDNILMGDQVVVNYTDGYALSLPAISIQGGNAGNGDHIYNFDDAEYMKLPRVVAADFIAPDLNGAPLTAQLVLFALDFTRAAAPFVDCNLKVYDADENPTSRSIQFGCWDWFNLTDISTEFAYPNLGQSIFASDTHGWLQLTCEVNGKGGGVHGAIVQRDMGGSMIRRNAPILPGDPAAPTTANPTAWARALYQSVTVSDAMTLTLQ